MSTHITLGHAGGKFPSGEFLVQPPPARGPAQVFGEPDFQLVSKFKRKSRIYKLSRKVAYLRVVFDSEFYNCTGFLVGARLLLTNHHCIVDDNNKEVTPKEIYVYMDYYKYGAYGKLSARGKNILKSDQHLDYALVSLTKNLGKKYGWFKLDTEKRKLESVNIIQHPKGRPRSVVQKNTKVVTSFFHKLFHTKVLHYYADTDGGSSGSPVFSPDGTSVIAIHRTSLSRYNEGVLMKAIVPEIRQWLR